MAMLPLPTRRMPPRSRRRQAELSAPPFLLFTLSVDQGDSITMQLLCAPDVQSLAGKIEVGDKVKNTPQHVTEARFRCRDCGEIVEKQVRPPVPFNGWSSGLYLACSDAMKPRAKVRIRALRPHGCGCCAVFLHGSKRNGPCHQGIAESVRITRSRS